MHGEKPLFFSVILVYLLRMPRKIRVQKRFINQFLCEETTFLSYAENSLSPHQRRWRPSAQKRIKLIKTLSNSKYEQDIIYPI